MTTSCFTGLTVLDYFDSCFCEELRRSDPIDQERASFSGFPGLSENEEHFQEQKQLDPIVPEQANHHLSPVSKAMISDSVELCETEVCFLHIQLIGTKV